LSPSSRPHMAHSACSLLRLLFGPKYVPSTSSETSVYLYQTTRRDNLEEGTLYIFCLLS
jgi:hypothetical protein